MFLGFISDKNSTFTKQAMTDIITKWNASDSLSQPKKEQTTDLLA
jgi:hypothetical protein